MELDHVRLLVDDYAEAFRFTRDTLGLAVTWGDEETGYASFATGAASLSIFERSGQSEVVELRPCGDETMAIIRVDDVDGTARRLGLAEPISRPDWGIRSTYLRDPSGNLLEFYTDIPMEQ